MFVKPGFAFRSTFITQAGDDSFQQSHGPGAVIEFVRAQVVSWIDLVAGVGILPVERKRLDAAASFLAAGAVPFIGEKTFYGDEQKSPEFPLILADALEIILFQQAGEKGL